MVRIDCCLVHVGTMLAIYISIIIQPHAQEVGQISTSAYVMSIRLYYWWNCT